MTGQRDIYHREYKARISNNNKFSCRIEQWKYLNDSFYYVSLKESCRMINLHVYTKNYKKNTKDENHVRVIYIYILL